SADNAHCFTDAAFDLFYSWHDGADTFVTVLEIHARKNLCIMIECPHSDLHGCYINEGSITVRNESGDELVLQNEQYLILYAPKGMYSVSISKGLTIIRLWCTNDQTLIRNRNKTA